MTGLLLAAPPVPPAADPLGPLYMLIGSVVVLQLIGMAVAGVKWLGTRTVEREDRDKEALRSMLKEHEERFEEQDKMIASLDRSVVSLQAEVKQAMHALESIRGGVSEVRLGLDSRFEKQAEFYRSALKEFMAQMEKKLEDLEIRLRQDTARAMHDVQTLARGKGR